MHTYATNHRIHPDMLRDIDRWIMGGISQEMERIMEMGSGGGHG